ncbi:MAG: hypothetical protein GAK35_02383 [Herbaspirillum frisingense]|uniref:DUF1799 domain-containing protein n=1 Tax=Herbaspirillum frisingense TaxID=92645 RepID=A0A7V8FW70_9BURK|nr:MAG: hypothetical protein GAK35_02383 [Herbaspirillum frisingense]
MYRPAPDLRQLQAIGLKPEDLDPAALGCDVYPENMPAVQVFEAMDTQWRTGMGGVYGLDYAALPAVLRMLGIGRNRWKEIFSDLRVMEAAALEVLQETS